MEPMKRESAVIDENLDELYTDNVNAQAEYEDLPTTFVKPDRKAELKKLRKKAMLRGTIHAIGRYQGKCEFCEAEAEYIEDIKEKRYYCIHCNVSPSRFCVDVHFSAKRYRIYSDIKGIPLDSYERAFSLLIEISEQVRLKTFDYTNYIKTAKANYQFEAVVENWLRDKEKEVLKNQITDSYLRILKSNIENHILPYFRKMDVREIRTINIKNFYMQLPIELSSKTHKNIMSDLENIFSTLEHDEIISVMPKFPTVTVLQTEIKWIDRKTQDKIISKIEERHRPIIFFLTRQGCRPGEALALTWHDVDLKNEKLTIRKTISDGKLHDRPKNKEIKPRLLNPENAIMLENMPKALPSANVFINPDTHKIYSLTKLETLWNTACEAVEVKDINLYAGTRHSVASQASSANVDLQAIRDVLGHSKIATTEKYAHTNLEAQRQVFENGKTKNGYKTATKKKSVK